MPTYSAMTIALADNFIKGDIQPQALWGGQQLLKSLPLPSLRAMSLGLWSGSGSQLGKIDRIALPSGTLTDDTPGTTDTADVDLTALTDPFGNAVSLAEVCLLAIFNLSTVDGEHIVVGGTAAAGATNPWTAPFADMTTPADGRLRVPAGWLDSSGVTQHTPLVLCGGGNLAALPVSGTSKVLRLYSAGASVPYSIIVAGRSAAS